MPEFGLLWRLQKGHERFDARIAHADGRGHVLVLRLNDDVVSSEMYDDGPMAVLIGAQNKKAELLACGWTEEPHEELPFFEME